MNEFAHECFGIAGLGLCNYNPAAPVPTYFTLGDAIAALAFTFAVQNFLKPIYRFRLEVRYLSIRWLYGFIFAAVAMTLIAALVPQIPALHGWIWGYAIVYEILAMVLFVVAYSAVAIAAAWPVRVRERRMGDFARAIARYLSEATDSDFIDLLPDLKLSLPICLFFSSKLEKRRRKTNAFQDFADRQLVERGQFARAVLNILADPKLCKTLVVRAPWGTANLVEQIRLYRDAPRAAQPLIQELSHQSILASDSMLGREIGYHGFRSAPVLSQSLFADATLLHKFTPFGFYIRSNAIDEVVLERFNRAAVLGFLALIEARRFDETFNSSAIVRFYESAGSVASALQKNTGLESFQFRYQFGQAARNAISLAERLMAEVSPSGYDALFLSNAKDHRFDLLQALVGIVMNALTSVAIQFKGPLDPFWGLAIESMTSAFDFNDSAPAGMTPFQQRLAVEMTSKMKDNMKGFYYPICRVLLSTIEPARSGSQSRHSAYNILSAAIYGELKNLDGLLALKPERAETLLPPMVTYSQATGELTRTYFGGRTASINVRNPQLANFDLFDPAYRRVIDSEERDRILDDARYI